MPDNCLERLLDQKVVGVTLNFVSPLAEGLAFVRRYSGGADIRAACGTLSSNSATTGR